MPAFPLRLIALALLCATALPFRGQAQSLPAPLSAKATQTAAPYFYAGRIVADFGPDSYIATGTVIKQHSVITCGHILYDPQYGWATHVQFERALHENTGPGGGPVVALPARAIFVLAGYASSTVSQGQASDLAFSRDLGALRFANYAAQGGYAGYTASPALLLNVTKVATMSLGYGGQYHDGRQLLKVSSNAPYTVQRGAFLLNSDYDIEEGMSGGPIFINYNNAWYVSGVNVSSDGFSMGMHALDATANQFIATNLN